MEDINHPNKSFDAKFVNPVGIIEQLNVTKGSIIADFGCGMGHFSLEMSKIIGENGTVYSFDILPEKLESVISGSKRIGTTNVITKRANLEKERGSGLENDSVDWVVMKDMLFQNKDKKAILTEAYRILKPKGKALIIEWKMEITSVGPARELRMSEEALEMVAQSVGLVKSKKINSGDFHYALVFAK